MWVCRGISWGLEDEQVNQDLEREGIGSGEREEVGELWNEKKYERVRFFQWIGWQYLRQLELHYGMSFENE